MEIREGERYQCFIEGDDGDKDYQQQQQQQQERVDSLDDEEYELREYCLWEPNAYSCDDDIVDYLSIALGVYNIEQDRALYILYKCDHNLEEAYEQLTKRRFVKEDWSKDDVASFLKAFKANGKRFRKIAKSLPHKSLAQIINFYYDMKKKLHLKSILEQRRREGIKDDSKSESSDSEPESDEETMMMSGGECEHCTQRDTTLKEVGGKNVCSTCYLHCKNYHRRRLRLASTSQRDTNTKQRKIKCPLSMVDIAETFDVFYEKCYVENENENDGEQPSASTSSNAEDDDDDDDDLEIIEVKPSFKTILKALSAKHADFTRRYKKMLSEQEVLTNRERARCVRMQHGDALQANYHGSDDDCMEKYSKMLNEWEAKKQRGASSPKPLWDQHEIFQVFLGFRHFGRDFEAIADTIETKTLDMIKDFYEQHKDHAEQMISKYHNALKNKLETVDFDRIIEVPSQEAELVELD